jgi:hypothetical protein
MVDKHVIEEKYRYADGPENDEESRENLPVFMSAAVAIDACI